MLLCFDETLLIDILFTGLAIDVVVVAAAGVLLTCTGVKSADLIIAILL